MMTLTADEALTWLRSHETAFNTGDWAPVLDDYTEDCVLEVHLDGRRVEFVGREEVLSALKLGSAAGVHTHVERVVVGPNSVAAQICDDGGQTFMTSFWELRNGQIGRDVSIICSVGPQSP